jgi:HAD superfamily hydrolase (TIGR01509 family)
MDSVSACDAPGLLRATGRIRQGESQNESGYESQEVCTQVSIKAVIFDIGGVLLTHGEWDYRRDAARAIGLEALPDRYQTDMERLQRGEIDEEALWAQIAGGPVDGARLDDAWSAHYRPVAPMVALAAELRSLGIRTALLSNTQPTHVRVMRRTMAFIGEFDPVVMSCEAGVRKPEPRAFAYVLGRLGLPAAEVAFVDDIEPYVAAGRAAGLQAIQHTGNAAVTRRVLLDLLGPA